MKALSKKIQCERVKSICKKGKSKIEWEENMENKEKELLWLLKKQPEEGICKIIDEYAAAVKTICSHILRDCDQSLVEDAIQESFIRIWKHCSSGGKIKKSLKAYVYQIARNCALDNLRKYKREQCVSLEVAKEEGIEALVEAITGTVEEEFIRRQNERIVHEVIDAMQEPNRTIFILRYFYFYKVKEIASYLKLKEDNVESRLRRGKKQLQDRLLSKGILYRSKEGKKRKWKGKGETAENGG